MDGSKNHKNLQQKTPGIPGGFIIKKNKKSYYFLFKNSSPSLKTQYYPPGIPGIVLSINTHYK
jgi:hypothetical protein